MEDFAPDSNRQRFCTKECRLMEWAERPDAKQKARLYAQTHRVRHPTAARQAQLKHSYGTDLDSYNAKFVAQDGRCAICGERSEKTLHQDHNHATGAVRDLLCQRCNHGVGNFGDDPNRMLAAAAYVLSFTDLLREVSI